MFVDEEESLSYKKMFVVKQASLDLESSSFGMIGLLRDKECIFVGIEKVNMQRNKVQKFRRNVCESVSI